MRLSFCFLVVMHIYSLVMGGQGQTCVFTAPYAENFDGNNWISGVGSLNLGNSLDSCWTRPSSSNPNFGVRIGATGSHPNTGPASDANGSGKYIYSESSGAGNSGEITSPLIFIPPGIASPHLRFAYHMAGPNIDSLLIQADSGTGFFTVLNLIGEQQISGLDAWRYTEINLNSFKGDTLRFRFIASHNSDFGDIALDDISLETVSCYRPDSLYTTSLSVNSLQLNWLAGSTGNWQVEYGQAGFIPGSGTKISTPATSVTISGLSPNITYDFYVRDSCAPNQYSLWRGPARGGTTCPPLSAPFTENFDGLAWLSGTGIVNGGNIIDWCWQRTDQHNANFGTRTGAAYGALYGPRADRSGNGNYLLSHGLSGNSIGRINTPKIFVPPGIYNPQLKFSYFLHGPNVSNFRIKVDTGTGFLPAIYSLVGEQQTSITDAWRVDSVSLDAYRGDTIVLQFIGSNNGFNATISLDEISILPDSSTYCAVPDSLLFSNITPFSATITWSSLNNHTHIEIVPLGQSQGSGISYKSASPPLVVTNLQPGSSYTVYVQDSCRTNATSTFLSDTFSTSACPLPAGQFSYQRNFLNINFSSGGTVSADSLFWEFGDGNNSSQFNPNYTYSSPGVYTVVLKAYSICDSLSTTSQTIQVCDTPIANWGYSILSNTSSGMTVQFNASASLNAVQYYWNFGDGNTISATANPIHTYSVPSLQYMVTLEVKNDCGDSSIQAATLQDKINLNEFALFDNIKIWPNPANKRVWVEFPKSNLNFNKVELISFNGKCVFSRTISDKESKQTSFEIQHLPAGTYFMQIYTDQGVLSSRLIIN